MNEKVYQFNEYVLGYDKGLNDRSCLTISKIQNDTIYFMGTLYDGSAEVISVILDNFQKEIRNLQQERDKYKSIVEELKKWLETDFISLYLEEDYTSKGWSNIIKRKIKELEEGSKEC